MVEQGHFASEDIKSRLSTLHDHWNLLKEKAAQRKQDLEDSLQVHNINQYSTLKSSEGKEIMAKILMLLIVFHPHFENYNRILSFSKACFRLEFNP